MDPASSHISFSESFHSVPQRTERPFEKKRKKIPKDKRTESSSIPTLQAINHHFLKEGFEFIQDIFEHIFQENLSNQWKICIMLLEKI